VIRIIFTDEARADTLNAFAFYEERRPGLGERFREHVDLAIWALNGKARSNGGSTTLTPDE
jgi:hypothetical protein